MTTEIAAIDRGASSHGAQGTAPTLIIPAYAVPGFPEGGHPSVKTGSHMETGT